MECKKIDGEYLNDKLTYDNLVQIFSQLTPGMILRCCGVCKSWNTAGSDGYMWLRKFSKILEFDPKLNLNTNIKVNKELIRVWSDERNVSPKRMYVLARRGEKIPREYKIFP